MKHIYIGTSGWHYKHWIGTFYPSGITAKQQFEHYALPAGYSYVFEFKSDNK